MKNLDAKVVKDKAFGNWEDVLKRLAPEIPDKAYSKLGRHVPCPVHGNGTKGDGFKLFKKDFHETGGGMCNTCGMFHDGFSLLMWLRNWDFATAVEAVGECFGITNNREQSEARKVNKEREAEREATRAERLQREVLDNGRIRARLQSIWKESIPLTDPLAEPARLYLASRKILCWDRPGLEKVIRFHKSLPSYNENRDYEGNFPAIVSMVCNDGKPVTIHRIFITHKGEKAPIESVKKMCEVPSDNMVSGGAIITSGLEEELNVAEGVETSLAVETAMGVPCWPLVNATLMELFNPPEGVKRVRIWVDKDRSEVGVEAGKKLKARLWEMGISACLMTPSLDIPDGEKGVDWNDVLVQLGRYGFPQRTRSTRVA
ncbi:DUF7146 domain-containing protein [Pseudomonas aeruginosa]